MSGKVVGWAFDEGESRGLELSRRFVLVAYADNADRDGKCFPGMEEITGKTGASRATWYRAKDELVAAGLLVFTEDKKGREYVQLAVPWSSHCETNSSQDETEPPESLSQRETGNSHGEKSASHGETGTNKGTVSEPSSNQQQPDDAADPIAEIYDFWKRATHRNGSTKLTPGRRAAIKARLDEGREPRFIKQAIANVAASDFHQGQNERKRRFDDLTLICRNGEKLEGYAEMGSAEVAVAMQASLDRAQQPLDDEGQARHVWDEAKERLRATVSDSTFGLWIAPFEAAGVRGETLVLVAYDASKVEWAKRRYTRLFVEALEGAYTDVELISESELEEL